MLSIGAMKCGQDSYYQNLARDDYYLEGGEPPGYWLGLGASHLDLKGLVKSNELSSLFHGFSPNRIPLVQNAGKANRQSGWDLTFSAPKSVSVLWSQLQGEQQRAIVESHTTAVESTIAYLEEHYGISRLGKGGTDEVKVRLLVAAFEHSCSRALDPQLHTHCLVLNLGIDQEGKTRTILSKPLYQAKMLLGAYYRLELARQLQARLGVKIERPSDSNGKLHPWFEIRGLSEKILSHFSKRRASIEEELGRLGIESASAAAFAALSTREAKTIVPPRTKLYEEWRLQGEELGFNIDDIPLRKPTRLRLSSLSDKIRQSIEELTFSENTFTEKDVIQNSLESSLGSSISASRVVQGVKDHLGNDPQYLSLGTRGGRSLWTTQEILDIEKEFINSIDELSNRPFSPVANTVVRTALAIKFSSGGEGFRLSEEQQDAVRYITQGKGSIKVITGYAGTGKTDMLSAAKDALEKGGYRVIGAALAGVAARSLEEKTGIPSTTIRQRELQLFPNLKHILSHHTNQLIRAALGKQTFSLSKLTLDSKTVLVVDEAGMVGTRDFALLTKAALEQGGTIVALGDHRQLRSIERGGCLTHLVEKLGGAELTEIRRQANPNDRQAVLDVVQGDADSALRHYAKKGAFFVGKNRQEAELELVKNWAEQGGSESPSDHRIFVSTRVEVKRLNELCQWERVQSKQVDPTNRVEYENQIFMVGDQVRFNASVHTLGIKKGESGTVIACSDGLLGKYVAVRRAGIEQSSSSRAMEAARHHAIQLIKAALGKRTEKLKPRRDIMLAKTYKGLSLDYAMTTHLGQGQTVKHSYVLLGGKMTDRELSYVQMSRHKESLHLYGCVNQAGHELTSLARSNRQPTFAQTSRQVPNYSELVDQMNLSKLQELAHKSLLTTNLDIEEYHHANS